MKRLLFWVFVIQIGLYAAPAYAQFSLFEQQALKQIVSQWISAGSTIGGAGHTIEDEGTPLTQRANINFTGAGITCTDDNPDTKCDVPGGSVDQTAAYTWTGANSWRDNNFSILDNGDTSKILKFELSGITTATTRTLTIPNASGTVALTTSNVATATALAANGANCSAGQFPLGVDTLGAAESCTALPTTIAGTANQITASAATGAITLSIPTSPTLPGTTTGTFSGPITGNITSTGQSTFSGSLLVPGKADPGSPITNEIWRSTTAPLGLKWYDGSIIQRSLMDSNFPGSGQGLLYRSGVGTYTVLDPTDDSFPIGNGTAFALKTIPNCRPSLGQGWSYDATTNTLGCETVSTSGLASVTEDADSVNIAKTVEVGVMTNPITITRGGSITAARAYSLNIDADATFGMTTGTLTQNQLGSFDSAGRTVASGTTKWFKAYWDGGAITPDGTNCADATKQTLNSGPVVYTFSCADSNSSIFYGQVQLTRAVTTAIFTLTLFHAASESITFAGDFSAMCRADNTTINNTWGTAVAADVALTTSANQTQSQSTTSVTPNGTCSSGATLFWRYVVDAANFSANAANSKVIGVLMEQDS